MSSRSSSSRQMSALAEAVAQGVRLRTVGSLVPSRTSKTRASFAARSGVTLNTVNRTASNGGIRKQRYTKQNPGIEHGDTKGIPAGRPRTIHTRALTSSRVRVSGGFAVSGAASNKTPSARFSHVSFSTGFR